MNTNEILKKLSKKDIKVILESKKSNYTVFPKLGKDGRILPSQWKSWQILQRLGLAYINGNFEMGELQLSESGKELAKEIK